MRVSCAARWSTRSVLSVAGLIDHSSNVATKPAADRAHHVEMEMAGHRGLIELRRVVARRLGERGLQRPHLAPCPEYPVGFVEYLRHGPHSACPFRQRQARHFTVPLWNSSTGRTAPHPIHPSHHR